MNLVCIQVISKQCRFCCQNESLFFCHEVSIVSMASSSQNSTGDQHSRVMFLNMPAHVLRVWKVTSMDIIPVLDV